MRAAAATMEAEDSRLSNIVFMGMGEPLANYKRVVSAVRQITEPSPRGFGISQRNVVVCTVGLGRNKKEAEQRAARKALEAIERLAPPNGDEDVQE